MEQTIELPENYFRVFRSLAQLIEEKLIAMQESFVRFQAAPRVHLIYENDLDQQTTMLIQEQIQLMFAALQAFVMRYHIPHKRFSLRKQIIIQNAFLWEDLENSRSRHIRGHGVIDEAVMQDLDAFLGQMIAISNRIGEICENN